MPRYTLDGPAGQIIARGNTLPVDLVELITDAVYDAGVDATGQLSLTLDDRELKALNSGLFQAGTKTTPGSPLDWGARKMEVRVVDLSSDGALKIQARALGVCKMQRARGTRVTANVSPSRWLELEAKANGLKAVCQPSPVRPTITRQADESSWDTGKRLAREVGYLFFEADGVVYFAQPSWLIARPGSRALLIDVDPTNQYQPVDPRVLHRPDVRTSGDADVKVADLSVDVLPELGDAIDPGWTLRLSRLPMLSGTYLVDKVTIPLAKDARVAVSASTPINPKPEPPSADPTTSRQGSSGGVIGVTSTGDVRSPGAGSYGGQRLNATQVGLATVIVRTCLRENAGERGAVIALMTAMQESTLRNINYGDRDSIGLFQQRRPWGTNAERLNPETTTRKFLHGGTAAGTPGLLDLKGWQSLPLGVAAQKVQRSAFPTAYNKWERMARALTTAILKTARTVTSTGPAGGGSGPTAQNFVRLCLAQAGDRYVFGAEARASDPNPDAFDCSELVEWACARIGVRPKVPDGSSAQLAHVRRISVEQGKRTPGALLFHPGHVAVSLGNGRTIEAANRRYGVRTLDAGRRFTAAGLIPGMRY